MYLPDDVDWGDLSEFVDRNGNAISVPEWLTPDRAVAMYRDMVTMRVFDRRATTAQRQGRLGTFAVAEGHEAVQIGTVSALAEGDFIYPGYREHGVQLARNVPMTTLLAYWRGIPNTSWDPNAFNQMIITIPIASHLPHAVGHAYAKRLNGEPIVTVAYIGDGGTSENDFHSGVNFAGVWKTPTVFVVSDNHYAISVPYEKQTAARTIADKAIGYGIPSERVNGFDVVAVHDAMRRAVDRARSGGGPTLIDAVCYRFGPHATADDPALYRTKDEESAWRALDPVDRMRSFITAQGWWTQEEETALHETATAEFQAALDEVTAIEAPPRSSIVLNTFAKVPATMVEQLNRLERNAGERETEFPPSEQWRVGVDDLPSGTSSEMMMADAIHAALHQEMELDPTTILLGEDVGVAGGVFRISEGLLDRFGEERVIDTPLNESGIIGAAIGMAIAGARPIVEIQFEGFSYPAFDQIASHLGRVRFRLQGHAHLPMVIRMPSGAGIHAPEHHCDSPEALFAHLPGVVVVVPSSPADAKGLLAAAIRSPDPVIFLEPKVLYRQGREPVPSEPYELPIGRARTRRPGTDITLVTYGAMTQVSLKAAEAVADDINVEVIDLRTVYPWDVETVSASVRRTGRLLFVQEPQRTGGVGAEVVAEIAERNGYDLVVPPRRLTGTDAPWPQSAIESLALLNPEMVAAELRSMLR